ncbi:hypothetical protein J7337_000160 [Fusarium musae]|uniref:Uncharacterized protein n=1 Tax=Fusarium musae TaxID=1042133 RepID=A0A9P8DR33_9HYPO|nr:hypothetical protein J7337_000160 [Fusarium musae]KAG9506627.1 hypothetical protein J7337_000160 [Fusarium musae]
MGRQWTFFNKKIEAFKAQPNDGSAPSLSSRRRLLVSNSARKRGVNAKKGGSDEEPSALKLQEPENGSCLYNNPRQASQDSVEPTTRVVTNQVLPVPIDSFMPMNEFARPITTLKERSQITRLVEGTLQRFGIQPDGALTLYGVPFQ